MFLFLLCPVGVQSILWWACLLVCATSVFRKHASKFHHFLVRDAVQYCTEPHYAQKIKLFSCYARWHAGGSRDVNANDHMHSWVCMCVCVCVCVCLSVCTQKGKELEQSTPTSVDVVHDRPSTCIDHDIKRCLEIIISNINISINGRREG